MDLSSTSSILRALETQSQTSESLVQAALTQISERDHVIGAFLETDVDQALTEAQEIDRRRQAGDPIGPLAGLPIAIKDNIHIKGRPTTCASKILANFVPPFDATVVQKLKEADAILLGKTNLDEFAMGSSTEHSAYQITRNPVNPEFVPGGSSGGSTAAVAAGMVPLALGSSTGGSIRQPASFCGVVGLKPTYGLVSRYGLVSYGSSLDQIGPIAGDIEGVARLLQVIAGHDPADSTSADRPSEDFLTRLDEAPTSLRVGLPAEYLIDGLADSVRHALDHLVTLLSNAGVQIKTVSIPHTEYAISSYYLIATAEASSNLARFDGVRYSHRTDQPSNLKDMYTQSRNEGFGLEVKRRILLGTYCLSSGYYEGYYRNAQRVRTKLIHDFRQAFTEVDVMLAPVSPTTVFKIGDKKEDPMAMYLSDIFSVTANLVGIPAISLPAGKDQQGLPIGLQFMGPHFAEPVLLRSARLAERLLNRAIEG